MLVVSEEKSFMVMASTAIEKDGWLQAIRLCMRDLSANVAAREGVYSGGSNTQVRRVRQGEKETVHGQNTDNKPDLFCMWAVVPHHNHHGQKAKRTHLVLSVASVGASVLDHSLHRFPVVGLASLCGQINNDPQRTST